MKEIIIDINDKGEVQVQTRGFKGKACLQESEFLKEILGTEIHQQLTPAYFEQEKVRVKKYLPLCG
ncbi:MAG: DUF2997 domain-containing protein [Desulfovermiculus sp.]|nr:DUF2997 domain-containing protein [Desulfovermiculus sp.]